MGKTFHFDRQVIRSPGEVWVGVTQWRKWITSMYVQLYVIFVVYYLFWNKLIGRMSLGLGAQESRAGRACPHTTRWQTWWPYHSPPPGTRQSGKVVSGILTHRTLLTDGSGGREQPFDNFKIASKFPNLDSQWCATWHVCTLAQYTKAPCSLREGTCQPCLDFNFS